MNICTDAGETESRVTRSKTLVKARSVSILILNCNGRDLLARCLPSVVEAASYDGAGHKVVVIDNASDDGSVEFVRSSFPSVFVRRMEKNMFLFAYNEVAKECPEDYIILLNNDIIAEKDFISPLMRHFDDPRVFAVTSRINAATLEAAYTCRRRADFSRGKLIAPRDDTVAGAAYTLFAHGGCAAYDRAKFLQLGGFNTLFWPLYGEDDDLSYFAWMTGYIIVFEPESQVFHLGGASTARFFKAENEKRATRERAAMSVILKNIADRGMLASLLIFLAIRSIKAAISGDRYSLKAQWGTVIRLREILRARANAQSRRKLTDREIFRTINANQIGGTR